MLPRVASLPGARVALGGAAATAAAGTVAQSTNPPISRGQVCLVVVSQLMCALKQCSTQQNGPLQELVTRSTPDDEAWVVAEHLHLQPEEIDRELDLIINLGSDVQHGVLVLTDHRTPSVASDVQSSVDSGDAEAWMHASQMRINTTSHEMSLLRRAVHDLLSDAGSQEALFRAVQRSDAVRELLQVGNVGPLLPHGYAACDDALRGQEQQDRMGDVLRAAGNGLQNLGAALSKHLQGFGMVVLEFFAGLGKQVREAAASAEMQAIGGVVALATGVFVMALVRRVQ